MAIDFTLTDSQKKLQKTAREFAKEVLDPVVRDADQEPDPQKAFAMMKAPYVAWYGSEAQKQRWIGEATSDPTGEYLAGWTVSEAAGTLGGTANFDHPGAAPFGIALLATYDKGSGEYVLGRAQILALQCGGTSTVPM